MSDFLLHGQTHKCSRYRLYLNSYFILRAVNTKYVKLSKPCFTRILFPEVQLYSLRTFMEKFREYGMLSKKMSEKGML
jgi:hypothetical protein